jgi:hypothetical protein
MVKIFSSYLLEALDFITRAYENGIDIDIIFLDFLEYFSVNILYLNYVLSCMVMVSVHLCWNGVKHSSAVGNNELF